MKTNIRSTKNLAVIEIDGNLTHDTIGTLNRKIDTTIKAGCTTIILTLKKTAIMLSTGIHFFVETHDRTSDSGGKLILAELSKEIKFTLRISKLEDFFNTCDTVAEALANAGIRGNELNEGLPVSETKIIAKKQNSDNLPRRKTTSIGLKPVTAAGEESEKEKKSDEFQLSDAELETLVKHHIPNRTAVDVLDYYIVQQNSFAEIQTLATILRLKEKELQKTMQMLTTLGVLKSVGGNTFNYAPAPEINKQLQHFLKLWHQHDTQPKLFSLVLKHEK